MRKINAMLLALLITAAPCFAKAELSTDEIDFLRESTAQWEWAFGTNELWDCRILGLFCTIYRNYPNGTSSVADENILPRVPPDDLKISSEEAIDIAKAFLMNYEPRITSEYMQKLAAGAEFIDVTHTEDSSARCNKIWIIKFYEDAGDFNYLMKCDAYINADNGQVFMIDLMLDRTSEEDNNCQTIEF